MKHTDTISKAEFAKTIGVTATRVSKMVEEGLPVQKGRIVLYEGIQFVRSKDKKGSTDIRSRKVDAEVRLLETRQALAEIDLEKQRSDLLSVDRATTIVGQVVAAVVEHIKALPSKIAPNVYAFKTASEAEAYIQEETDRVIHEIQSVPERLRNARVK